MMSRGRKLLYAALECELKRLKSEAEKAKAEHEEYHNCYIELIELREECKRLLTEKLTDEELSKELSRVAARDSYLREVLKKDYLDLFNNKVEAEKDLVEFVYEAERLGFEF